MGGNSSRTSLQQSGQHLAHQLQRAKQQMAGVGLIFRRNPEGALVVKEIVKGSSADLSGVIQLEDILSKVENHKICKLTLEDISGLILGNPGDEVRLSFVRRGAAGAWREKKYSISLQRTVPASPEPTMVLQTQGGTTVVTMLHLDCLQQKNSHETLSPHPFGLVSAPMTPSSGSTSRLAACAETESNCSSSVQSSASTNRSPLLQHSSLTPSHLAPPMQTQPALAEDTHAPPEEQAEPVKDQVNRALFVETVAPEAEPDQEPEVNRALFVETVAAEPEPDQKPAVEQAPSPPAVRELSYELAGLQADDSRSEDASEAGSAAAKQEEEEGGGGLVDRGAGLGARALLSRFEEQARASPQAAASSPARPVAARGVGELVRQREGARASPCKTELGAASHADRARLSGSLLIATGQ